MNVSDKYIDTVTYHHIPGFMFCVIEMVNGFRVIGQSPCDISTSNDCELMKTTAYDDAYDKLLGYVSCLAAEQKYQESIAIYPNPLPCARKVEVFSISQKFEWLLSQPIRKFSRFGAALVADCWCEIEGHIDLITRLSDGKLRCLHDLFYSMQRQKEAA